MVDAFTDLLPIGILGGDALSGVVPILVVNSLQVPSVLSVHSPWPDTDNSSSIWRPSEVKIAHFDVSWQHPVFCCICVWKHRPCLEELPSELVGVKWGRRVSFLFFPPSQCLSYCPSFRLISPSNLPRFLWVTFTREQLGKWLAEKDVWENVPEQAITFDKTMVPIREEEESQRVRALLVMKNAMQEGASFWSQSVRPTMYSTRETAVIHQAFLCCCTTMSVWPRGLTVVLGYHTVP